MEIVQELDIDLSCIVCGSSLEISSENFDVRKRKIGLEVKPCQKCINNAEDTGYENGQKSQE